MYQILLVEDDKSIREVIVDYMDEKGKDTLRLTLAEDGRACEGALERQTFDLIMLDVMLPDIDGFTLCRMIRKKDMVPIVFLTAKGSEEDILWGYGLGCDDYIVKPFSLATLYAKILAILRRTKQENKKETITCGAIRMDKQSCQVFVNEREGSFPRAESAGPYLRCPLPAEGANPPVYTRPLSCRLEDIKTGLRSPSASRFGAPRGAG